MTEDQAKTKWCPFSMGTRRMIRGDKIVGAISANRGEAFSSEIPPPEEKPIVKPHPACLCLASECMAWRWLPGHAGRLDAGKEGFCGLAGRLQP